MPETSVPSFWQQNAVEQYIYKDFTSRHTYPLRNQFSHLYESFRKGKFIKFKRQKVDQLLPGVGGKNGITRKGLVESYWSDENVLRMS